jgi:hypothetical protein
MLDGQKANVKLLNPNVVINKRYMPNIANDLFENILIVILYRISDVIGRVINRKTFGITIISIAEK